MSSVTSKQATRKKASPAKNPYRLTRDVIPHKYTLVLSPNLADLTFQGHVDIEIDVRKRSDNIRLNSCDLTLSEITLTDTSGNELSGTASFNEETEITTLTFAESVKGKCKLSVKYNGQIRKDGTGLFLGTWKDASEIEHRIMASQFEGNYARRAFPCFDQPDLKATFKVFMVADKHLKALSNGEALGIAEYDGEFGQGKKIIEFAETMKMSTYLVAFTMGELECNSPKIVNGVRLTIWTTKGIVAQTQGAMEAACFALDYFENYFGVPYPGGKKLDLVCVPGFTWGGMENVGLIVFTQNGLSVNDPEGNDPDNVGTYVVIFHEIAHQWFGNLVTMTWWDNLWLNESFATIMGWKGVAAWRPLWNVWDTFGPAREKAYRVDSLANSHAIQVAVIDPHNHEQMVDPISYEKGCSVLFQLEQYIGEEMFRRGISLYLKQHAFGNTVASDLWNALEHACSSGCGDAPVRYIMDKWIKTVGFPEVLVEGSLATGKFQIKQQPFRLLAKTRSSRKIWPLPLTFSFWTSDGEKQTRTILFDRKQVKIDLNQPVECIHFNAGGSGFYRVRYSQELHERLIANLENLSVIERYNLVCNADAQMLAGMMGAEQFFKLSHKFMEEQDETVWSAVNTGLGRIAKWTPDKQKQALRIALSDLLKDAASTHGWGLASKSMPLAKNWMPYHLNLNPVIQQASMKVLERWHTDKDSLEKVVYARAAMILHFAKHEMPEEFSKLQDDAKKHTAEELQRFVLKLSELHDETAPEREPFYLIASILLEERANDGNTSVDQFIERFPKVIAEKQPYAVSMRIKGLSRVDDADVEKKLKELFIAHPYPLGQWAIDQTLERIRVNVLARKKQSGRLAAYFGDCGC